MPNLVVRNVHVDIIKELKKRAVRHGRSVEAEHRAVLRAALLPPSFKDLLLSMPDFGPLKRSRIKSRKVRL
jgi:plasmid stability protein